MSFRKFLETNTHGHLNHHVAYEGVSSQSVRIKRVIDNVFHITDASGNVLIKVRFVKGNGYILTDSSGNDISMNGAYRITITPHYDEYIIMENE